jgi:hypothetical protein
VCRVYVDFEGVGSLPEDAVSVTTTATSFTLSISTPTMVHVLNLSPLHDTITDVTIRRKPDSLVLTVKKETAVSWWELTKGKPSVGMEDI